MSVFYDYDLSILKKINSIYNTGHTGNHSVVGAEMSSGKLTHTNANKMAYTYSDSDCPDNPMYAGSWLFNFLYSSGITQNYPTRSLPRYDWRTGITTQNNAGTNNTQKSTLFFGIIPIFWSNGRIAAVSIDDAYTRSGTTVWPGMPHNTPVIPAREINTSPGWCEINNVITSPCPDRLEDSTSFEMFNNWLTSLTCGSTPAIEARIIEKTVRAYKSLNNDKYTDAPSWKWDNVIHSDIDPNRRSYRQLLLTNAIGVGIDFNNPNSYLSCDFSAKDFTIMDHKKNESQTWQQYESSFPWIKDKKDSTSLRLGVIPKKTDFVNGQATDIKNSQLLYGYYKCAPRPDAYYYSEYNSDVEGTLFEEIAERDNDEFAAINQNYGWNVDGPILYADIARWSSLRYYMDEYYFGSMPVIEGSQSDDPHTLGTYSSTFNDVLWSLYSQLNTSTHSGYDINYQSRVTGSLSDTTPIISAKYDSGSEMCLNMYNYSTIPYITPMEFVNGCRSFRKIMDVVPLFAAKFEENSIYDGYCSIIHTFQSIIYNTYCNSMHYTYMHSDNNADHLTYNYSGLQEDDMPAIPINYSRGFRDQNQTKVVANRESSEYDNFVIRYIPNQQKLYFSFALKINSGDDGTPAGISAGKNFANLNDWIVWCNGNIYIVNDLTFRTYVYYTPADFDLLNDVGYNKIGLHFSI